MGRLFIGFETDSKPSEVELDGEQAAGKPVLEKLVGSLRLDGVRITEPLTEWDSYGWYIEVALGEAKLICMLQRSDEWLIQLIPVRRFIDRIKGRHYDAEMQSFAQLVCAAAHEAFGVPTPRAQTEAEFTAS